MNPNGKNRKAVCEAMMFGISISGGKAYFADYEFLKSVSLKGGEPELIFDFGELEEPLYLRDIIADGNYIYYLDDDGMNVGRIRTNGRNNEIIYESVDGEYFNFINISGDMLYIVAENYGAEQNFAVLAVSTGGGSARVVVSDSEDLIDITPILIWGDTIFFCGVHIEESFMDSDYAWFTVKRTGGALVPFRPFSIYDENYTGLNDDWDDWDDED
jgi:hypothetical protein